MGSLLWLTWAMKRLRNCLETPSAAGTPPLCPDRKSDKTRTSILQRDHFAAVRLSLAQIEGISAQTWAKSSLSLMSVLVLFHLLQNPHS